MHAQNFFIARGAGSDGLEIIALGCMWGELNIYEYFSSHRELTHFCIGNVQVVNVNFFILFLTASVKTHSVQW